MTDPDPTQGVYETLLVRDGAVQALHAHLERMRGSVQRLYGAPAPGHLQDRIRSCARQLGAGEHRLRIDVRPVGDGLDVGVATGPLPPRRPLFRLAPLAVPGGHSADKLADRDGLTSSGSGGPTPLLTDGPEVLEAAWANVWLVDGDTLVTPPLDGRILPGVTRARVITLGPALGLSTTEREIDLTELATSAVMLTSSLQLAAPAALQDAPEPTPPAVATIARIRDALHGSDWTV